ncbi:MAG: hypothetical protein ACD_54C00259G0002 [uncultured bacterium]|nr:MAG: hypothetical protein ACD_54C00259G0002 [uncultured bacterium]
MGSTFRRRQAVIGTDQIGIIVEGAAQRRVRAGAVIAFAVVFQHQLPVAVFDDAGLMRHFQIIQPVRRGVAICRCLDRGEIGGGFGQTDEHHACGHGAMDRFQPVVGGNKIRPHVARPQQAAIGFVGPLVVGADQLGRLARGLRANPAATVAAGIVERPQLPVIAAHDHDRISAELQRDIRSGLGQFCGRGGEQPLFIPDMGQVGLMQFRVGVERPRKRPAGALGVQQGNQIVLGGHGGVLAIRGVCLRLPGVVLAARVQCYGQGAGLGGGLQRQKISTKG